MKHRVCEGLCAKGAFHTQQENCQVRSDYWLYVFFEIMFAKVSRNKTSKQRAGRNRGQRLFARATTTPCFHSRQSSGTLPPRTVNTWPGIIFKPVETQAKLCEQKVPGIPKWLQLEHWVPTPLAQQPLRHQCRHPTTGAHLHMQRLQRCSILTPPLAIAQLGGHHQQHSTTDEGNMSYGCYCCYGLW